MGLGQLGALAEQCTRRVDEVQRRLFVPVGVSRGLDALQDLRKALTRARKPVERVTSGHLLPLSVVSWLLRHVLEFGLAGSTCEALERLLHKHSCFFLGLIIVKPDHSSANEQLEDGLELLKDEAKAFFTWDLSLKMASDV